MTTKQPLFLRNPTHWHGKEHSVIGGGWREVSLYAYSPGVWRVLGGYAGRLRRPDKAAIDSKAFISLLNERWYDVIIDTGQTLTDQPSMNPNSFSYGCTGQCKGLPRAS